MVVVVRGGGNGGRGCIVVRHIVVIVRQGRAAVLGGHSAAVQVLPGGRRWDMVGAAASHAPVDAVQGVLLHGFQVRDAGRDLWAHRHLLHAVVLVAGTQLDVRQVSVRLGVAVGVALRLQLRLLLAWLGRGGDCRIVHCRGASYGSHHGTTTNDSASAATRRDVCKIVAGGLLGDTVQAGAGGAVRHAAAAMATGGGGLQKLVMGCLVRRHTLRGIPLQAALQEVNKVPVLAVQDLCQRLAARCPFPALGVGDAARSIPGIEEETAPLGDRYEHLGWQAQHLHDAGQLLHLVLAGEKGEARVKLGKDAAWK